MIPLIWSAFRRCAYLSLKASLIAGMLGFWAAPAFADSGPSGRALTKTCKTCHHYSREKRRFGPHLVNVIGRPVGSVEDFRYSESLQKLGGEWDEARLAEYLNDPQAFAPGTNMKFPGFKDMAKARRAAAYIARKTTR